ALAMAPADGRVRLGVLRAAIALRRDSLALALDQAGAHDSEERASMAEALAGAAERLDDLKTAQTYPSAAINQRPQDDALVRHLKIPAAEQDRRAKNPARQPVIKNVIEQDQIVRPRIPRSAQ